MIVVTSINSDYFEINGDRFPTIYQPLKFGSDSIGIYNVYDTRFQLRSHGRFDEWQVEGATFTNVDDLIAALLPLIYKPIGVSTTFFWGNAFGDITQQTDLIALFNGYAADDHNHTTSEITNLSAYTGFDNRYYTKTESDAKYLEDAPSNGIQYVRKDGVWEVIDTGANTATWGQIIGDIALQTDLEARYAPISHTHTFSEITDLGSFTGFDTVYAPITPNGYVPLNASGQIDSAYLPSFVDDVVEYADEASFPATGESGKLYIDLSDNTAHRWTGSTYVTIGGSATGSFLRNDQTDSTIGSINVDGSGQNLNVLQGFVTAKQSSQDYRAILGTSGTADNFLVGGSTTDSLNVLDVYLRIRKVADGDLTFQEAGNIHTVYHSGNTSLGDYVAKAGDTMSGSLTIDRGTTYGSVAVAREVSTFDYQSYIAINGGNGGALWGWTNGNGDNTFLEQNGTLRYYNGSSYVMTVNSAGNVNAASFTSGDSTYQNGSINSNDTSFRFLNGSNALAISTGGVLVSNNYSDESLVPSNGIYVHGTLQTRANATLGRAGTTNGSLTIGKSDGGSINGTWQSDWWEWRRSGGGTIQGWKWDNYDNTPAAMSLSVGGELSTASNMNVGGGLTVTGTVSANGTYYNGDGKNIIQYTDSWLRLNPSNNFSSGIYCASSILRTDNRIQVGSAGANFQADSSGDVRISGAFMRTDHNRGYLEGSYNNIGDNRAQTNPIYIIGSSYQPNNTTLSNMYGIGYAEGSAASYLNSTDLGTVPSGWGMYVASDGNARIFLSGGNGNGYFGGSLYADNFILSSDIRKKKDIELLSENKDGINFYSFKYKNKNQKRYGVIAQEVEKVSPELIKIDDDGFKSVAYVDLIIKKLIEMQKDIDVLKLMK